MNNYCICLILCAIVSIPQILFSQGTDLSVIPTEVELLFQNTTKAKVKIVGVQPSGAEKIVVNELAPNAEIAVNSYPGNHWVAKVGDVVLAEYDATDGENQVIDLANTASWQLPVELVFQNDTDQTLNVYFVTSEGNELEYAMGLTPSNQFEQTQVQTGSLWRIKDNKNAIVAEYLADNTPTQVIDLKVLLEDYSKRVAVNFQNSTTGPVDIYWVHPDGSNVLYLPKLPSGAQVNQDTYPGHIWMLRQNDEWIATYIAGSEAIQKIDIADLSDLLVDALVGKKP